MMRRFVAMVCISLGLLLGGGQGWGGTAPDVAFQAVPTFECVGLYWSPAGAGDKVTAHVQYRLRGQEPWQEAMNLWYDGRAQGGRPAEYRGSIVHLHSGRT